MYLILILIIRKTVFLMFDIIICLGEVLEGVGFFNNLTPSSRNEGKENKQPVIPYWGIYCILSFALTVLFFVWFRSYFKIELMLYIVFATIVGLFVWGFLYVIIINLANFVYIKIIRRQKNETTGRYFKA